MACWMKNDSLNFQNLLFIISCGLQEINGSLSCGGIVHKIVNISSRINKQRPPSSGRLNGSGMPA
jgi:hypothetical protein